MKTKSLFTIVLISFGLTMIFSHSCVSIDDKVADIDGNVYKTVIIGDQEWFAENLKTTRYNDGSAIPNVTDDEQWANLYSGAYCWYDNDPSNGEIYGALYNWYAADTGKLCPEGWRFPTDVDWTKLTDYLDGKYIAGGKLKATGTLEGGDGLWEDPNEGATNETGFSALPGGVRWPNGSFSNVGRYGTWWSATQASGHNAWLRHMDSSHRSVGRFNFNETKGHSVRCLRDID